MYFSLNNPDFSISKYFLLEDIASLLNIDTSIIEHFSKIIDGKKVIDEEIAYKIWYKKEYNKRGFIIGGKKTSLDEEIINHLISTFFKDAVITRQRKAGLYTIDFSIDLHGKKVNIDFLGPGHFINTMYGEPKDPLERKNNIEDRIGEELILWPYWIPRNLINLKSIIEGTEGIGALYSCKKHFSDFVFTNSSDMIIEISKKFLTLEKGIGYIYDLFNAPFKVEHPIIEKIKSGKKPIEILIPKGSADKNFWIPDSLKK